MVDVTEKETPEERDAGEDSLELGIRAAFGIDPQADVPVARSALRAFRDRQELPRIALRETEDEPTPLVLARGKAGDELVWPAHRYQVSGEIARGGVGSVLRARDVDLGREVAVKVLLDAHRGNPEMTRRFLEEAQIGGQLEHPGIVPVHEIGLLADERPYFAMKLVKGQTLAQLLWSRAHPTEMRQRLLGVFEQICQTLAYAHSRGVIHRDLKPSNVMVGAFGEVQIMDWGLAKVLVKRGGVDDACTTQVTGDAVGAGVATARGEEAASITGSVMGTPAYMPPEQARGEVEDLDERSDVFGLGAILFEILTGEPPHRGKDGEEILRKARGNVEDVRRRLALSGADEELIRLTAACLRFDPRERPRNALVVAKRISGYLESVERRTQDLRVRAAKARLRLVVALLALVALVLGGGGYLWLDKEHRDREEKSRAAISGAMTRAKELRARAVSGDDPSLWDAALRESRLALELSSEGSGSIEAEAEGLHLELSREVRDQRTIRELERLREERDSDSEELEYRFREVFAQYGIDVDGEDVDLAARRIRDSGITTQLVLALDQWAVTNRFGPRPRARSKLLAIAQKADDDPWRERLRRAVQDGDRTQLSALASEAGTRNLAPSTFEVLAFALRDRSRTRAVWLRAQQLHPDDFWINLRLGDFLLRQRESEDAVQYLRAAVALRASSAHARFKLGSALAESGSLVEGLSHFAAAIRLDPEARFGWFYYRCAEFLEDHPEEIGPGDLEELLTTLHRIDSDGTRHHHEGLELLLAEVLFIRGEPRKSILVLEDAERSRLNNEGAGWSRRGPSRASALERHRRAVLPDLVSYASIDAALKAVDSGDADASVLARFRAANEEREDDDSRARVLYLEARTLQRRGQCQQAAAKFSDVLRLDESLPEPHIGLAECLQEIGESERAERTLRDALDRRKLWHADAWKFWARLVLVDLARPVEHALELFPAGGLESAGADRGKRYGEELAWSLEQIAKGDTIRINCGGPRARDDSGRIWERDRFYNSGNRWSPGRQAAPVSIRGTWRWFSSRNRGSSSDYEIPLPPGEYDVTLRITDPGDRFRKPGSRKRTATVRMEDRDSQFTLGGSTQRAMVEDGFLDLRFARRRRVVCVVAISLKRV